jgi:SAM-dependent methyltransferase
VTEQTSTPAPRKRTRKAQPAARQVAPPSGVPAGGGDRAFYDPFYAGAGFVYDIDRERTFVHHVLIPTAGWVPGDRVVEIGAGQGLHAQLLAEAGMDVTAVEVSPAGVDAARGTWPGLDVQCADAATWATNRPGHVYARGLSWYHYELTGAGTVNCRGVDVHACTARVMRDLVAPGCTFAMQIVTDLTGRHPVTVPDLSGAVPPDGRVHQSTVAEFTDLFGEFGDVTVTDWAGDPIVPGRRHDRGVLVVTRRPT